MSKELARESISLVTARAHVLQVNEILTELGVDPNCGLSTDENQIRIDRDGLNVIPARKSITVWERIWAQINSFLIFILVAGAAISFAFHHMLDGYVIVGVVVINVSLGYFMEGQAANATDALKKMMNPSALVLRDGEKLERDSTGLSQGDIFFLQPGDIIPADGRVLKAAGLFVLEAALTGESRAILKDTLPSSSQLASLADRKCMVYSGTQVLQGTATVVTTATGPRCEIGKISGLLAEIEPEKTPLLLQLDKFGMILSVVIIILACATFGIAYARGHPVDEALAIAIGVSVAAIPEGLPSCITVTFSIGVSYMAKQHAIVKSLPAVETLGSVSVICSDKTGTLTINKMTVKSICTTSEFFELDDGGAIISKSENPASSPAPVVFVGCLLPGILCNDSVLKLDYASSPSSSRSPVSGRGDEDIELGLSVDTASPGAEFTVTGDPTETCIMTVAAQLSCPNVVERLIKQNHRLDEIPFDSTSKYMATLHTINAKLYRLMVNSTTEDSFKSLPDNTTVKVVMVKGAPEKVLSLCFSDSTSKDYWMENANRKGRNGMRVLGLAFKVVPDNFTFSGHLCNVDEMGSDAVDRFTMLSLVGIMDPPRPEAVLAVGRAQRAGITVKMITGDHPVTALAIGTSLGLHTEGSVVITGTDLDRIAEAESMEAFDYTVLHNDLYARTTPEHKLRIVESLRRQGIVCSMTGDGVNDAPALKAANIGVAMGITGTEVAKDAADMIIIDDNFATIVEAIRTGRCVYSNLIKIICFVLPTNGGQAWSIIGALIIGVEVPITALQILWVNMVTSVTLGVVLAFDPPDDRCLQQLPRGVGKNIFGRLLVWRLVSVSAMLVLVVLGVYHWDEMRGFSVNYLRTVAVNALSVAQIGYIFSCRNIRKNLTPAEIFGGNYVLYIGIFAVVALQMLFTYSPGFQYVFQTENLDGESWGKIIFLGVCVFLAVELDKYISALTQEIRHPHMSAAGPTTATTATTATATQHAYVIANN